MLKCKRQNFHNSKEPQLGSIGHIVGCNRNYEKRKCIVIAYPLCDGVIPYSIGIHTCWIKFLDNGEIRLFSGFWFVESE